ncbi:hypothetical protein D8674_020345 [Pyrus ussuriensis x Pyrus communis]|uniref:Uncharacterized protein n=1 Tax=Pyrus ussuriensis x Pyrus communis TaxID=2448454 RepID=A0A5N5HIS3_9ROSA|nr:hypothetical protein D8674_020345 [Pyrus ussuriensis x Pyrus communis]
MSFGLSSLLMITKVSPPTTSSSTTCGRRSLCLSVGLRHPELQFGSFSPEPTPLPRPLWYHSLLRHFCFLLFDFCFGYACHFLVDFAVPNPMEEDVEDFEVVEREEAVEQQRAAGEDGGGQREDGKEY